VPAAKRHGRGQPAEASLARGELHAIGATTLKEYQKYIEKDKALERRFQAVMVDEPSHTRMPFDSARYQRQV
jgi:ATP-dependent Clp protease ATP-binding subunit ClpA